MKALINSIYLSSLYYMNSNNITMHKFGIENNYISMAMNSMLGKTNNTVKSMNISETNAMVVDYSWWCILQIVSEGFGLFAVLAAISLAIFATNGMALWEIALTWDSISAGIASLGLTIYITAETCDW